MWEVTPGSQPIRGRRSSFSRAHNLVNVCEVGPRRCRSGRGYGEKKGERREGLYIYTIGRASTQRHGEWDVGPTPRGPHTVRALGVSLARGPRLECAWCSHIRKRNANELCGHGVALLYESLCQPDYVALLPVLSTCEDWIIMDVGNGEAS